MEFDIRIDAGDALVYGNTTRRRTVHVREKDGGRKGVKENELDFYREYCRK